MPGRGAVEEAIQRLPDRGSVSIARQRIGPRNAVTRMTFSQQEITGPAIGVADIQMQRRKKTGEIRRERIAILASGATCSGFKCPQVPG
jgi:hypothetical protein